jgi:hypothetical protein
LVLNHFVSHWRCLRFIGHASSSHSLSTVCSSMICHVSIL